MPSEWSSSGGLSGDDYFGMHGPDYASPVDGGICFPLHENNTTLDFTIFYFEGPQ